MRTFDVLAVDDDLINRKLLKSILSKYPFVNQVFEAKDGSEALNILKENNAINLILLDLIMPVLNGIETLKIIHNDPVLKHIPVIVLTTDETKKIDALDSGATDFLIKPVREHALLEKMQRLTHV